MANIQASMQRIRFASDISQWDGRVTGAATDVITGSAMMVANGADLQLELMFSDGMLSDSPSTVVDFTNIDHVVIALQSSSNPHSAQTYWAASIPNANIVNTVTAAQWNAAQPNQTAQIVVTVANALNSFNLSSDSNETFWLCIYGVTSDATPKQVPYAFFNVTVVDTGMPVAAPVLPVGFKVGSKLSFLCSDGLTRDVTLQKTPNGIWALSVNQTGYLGASNAIYSLYCSDGFWRDESVILSQGVWTIQINQAGHS